MTSEVEVSEVTVSALEKWLRTSAADFTEDQLRELAALDNVVALDHREVSSIEGEGGSAAPASAEKKPGWLGRVGSKLRRKKTDETEEADDNQRIELADGQKLCDCSVINELAAKNAASSRALK